LEVETGIEPVCTALQAVASPLGHSTMGLMPLHPRADDGIRTRDPNLGKVVRYQLRYIRVLRARSSLVAKQNTSRRTSGDTNPLLGRGVGAQNRVYSWREIVNPLPVEVSRQVMPDSRLSHPMDPAETDWPNASAGPAHNAVSPAHTKAAGSPGVNEMPCP
jgi:hypothetical protein